MGAGGIYEFHGGGKRGVQWHLEMACLMAFSIWMH